MNIYETNLKGYWLQYQNKLNCMYIVRKLYIYVFANICVITILYSLQTITCTCTHSFEINNKKQNKKN